MIEQGKPNKNRQVEIINLLCSYLDNGYVYSDIYNDILNSFYSGNQFPHNKYQTRCMQDGNLIKQGIMYYHKELKIMNPLPVVNYDIDSGTMTSSKTEYYLEEVASYTINDLLNYFYSKNMADVNEYNPKTMYGLFKHMISKYGLDKVLFMIEGAARMYDAEHKVFTLNDFDSYSSIASRYLEEIKNNCKYSGGDKYVPRKRKLFD